MKPLEYGTQISAEVADEYYQEAERAFRNAQKKPYKNFFGKLTNRLNPEHAKELTGAFGVLLPLSIQEAVQQGQAKEATIQNISQLLQDIGTFQSTFRGTGVKMIGHSSLVRSEQRRVRRLG